MSEFFADLILAILAVALVWFVVSLVDVCNYNTKENERWWK